jgi:hypothetical protein
LQEFGIAGDIETQSLKATQRSSYRQRQLCTRSQTGMRQNGFAQDELIIWFQAKVPAERFEMRRRPHLLGSNHRKRSGASDGKRRCRTIESQTEAAEAPSEAPIQIEKA